MSVLEYILGALIGILAIALIWLIGAQQSKRKSGLSGSIAGNGASESYLTRNKIATRESSFKKMTLIVAIVFVVLVVALYIVGTIKPADEASDVASSQVVATSSTATVESSAAETSTESTVESTVESAVESTVESATESEVASSATEVSE